MGSRQRTAGDDETRRQRNRRQAQRHRDEEHRAPAEVINQQPARHRPHGRREHDAEAVGAHRPAAFVHRKDVDDRHHGQRLDQAGDAALADAAQRQQFEAIGQGGKDGKHDQQQQCDHIGAAQAETLHGPGGDQHRGCGGSQKAGGQELHLVVADMEDANDFRQRDIHHGGFHDRRDRAEHHRDHHPPAIQRTMAGEHGRDFSLPGFGFGAHEC